MSCTRFHCACQNFEWHIVYDYWLVFMTLHHKCCIPYYSEDEEYEVDAHHLYQLVQSTLSS